MDKLIEEIITIMTRRGGMDAYHDIDEEFKDEIKAELKQLLKSRIKK